MRNSCWALPLLIGAGLATADARKTAESEKPANANEASRRGAIRDMRKSDIETPLKKLVAQGGKGAARATGGRVPADAESSARPGVSGAGSAGFENPAVEPGKVRWHDEFDTALSAARKSGRPVLLFQLIGRLDEKFT